MADALSRRHSLFSMLETEFLSFDNSNEFYEKDVVFSSIFSECHRGASKDFYLVNQYLFKVKRLCILQVSLRESLIKEHLYWPHIWKHINNHCKSCIACMKAKSKVQHHSLYTHLPIPFMPWVDISMDFVLGLPRTRKGGDSIFMVVDRFSKMVHFISCHKVDDATYIGNLFFKKNVRLHGIPRNIVGDFVGEAWNQTSLLYNLLPPT